MCYRSSAIIYGAVGGTLGEIKGVYMCYMNGKYKLISSNIKNIFECIPEQDLNVIF